MWLAVENSLSSLTAPFRSHPIGSKLLYSSATYATGFCGPKPDFLPATYLEILQLEGGLSIFQRKYWAKRFPAELFPIPQIHVPYFLSHGAKIPNPIGLHGPPHYNFPEDISLSLQRPYNFLSPISPSAVWANLIFICHTHYNCWDNVRPCTP